MKKVKGTKYGRVDSLPKNALSISDFAVKVGIHPSYVYTKYERWLLNKKGGNSNPGYSIVQWSNRNWVIINTSPVK